MSQEQLTDLAHELAREHHLRRLAKRHGLRVVASPLRDPRLPGFGTFAIINVEGNYLVAGDSQVFGGFGLDLDDVEEFLTGIVES